MTTAPAASPWVPLEDRIPPPRWWAAVVTGVLAAVLVTPLGDLLSPELRLWSFVVLTYTSMGCGLLPTVVSVARAWWTEARPADGSVVLAAGALLAAVSGLPILLLTGSWSPLALGGVASAAHLVSARLLRGLIGGVPTDDPAAAATGRPRGPWTRRWQGPWGHAWVSAAAGVLAVGTAVAWVLVEALWRDGALMGLVIGAITATTVLLLASPAAFHIARHLPMLAARDRARELGIHYGTTDLLRLGGCTSLLLDPVGVVTDPQPRLVGVRTLGRLRTTAALQAAASVAEGSSRADHLAVLTAARERAIALKRTAPAGDDLTADGILGDIPDESGTRRRSIKDTIVTLGPAPAFDRIPTELRDPSVSLYVGWGGVARAGFELVPQVRSSALGAWPDLRAMGVRPVFATADPVALRHIGAAMEVPEADLRSLTPRGRGRPADTDTHTHTHTDGMAPATTTWGEIIDELARGGGLAVLGDRHRGHPHARPAQTGRSGSSALVAGDIGDIGGSRDTDGAAETPSPVVVLASRAGTAADPGPTRAVGHGYGRPHEHDVLLDRVDLTSAVRSLALARKAARVSRQGLVFVLIVQTITLLAAALYALDPMLAVSLGAALPLLAAANGLRPRSYARENPTD